MKKVYILVSILLVFFIIYISFSSHSQASNISSEDEYYYNEDDRLNEDGTIMVNNSPTQTNAIDTTKDSITALINKEFSLPADYVPVDLVVPDVLFNFNYYDEKKLMRQEAATALEALFEAAKKEGLNLYAISGYRSYARQKEIYDTNVATKGLEYTNRYSAKPGHSEHQTGLSMDVSTSSIGNLLEPVFAYTPEGKWLATNAHLFGFIIRYPEGKEDITGYSYEPWHVRYVGKDLAKYIFDNKLTLEEYYKYEPSTVEINELSYDNIIDVDKTTKKKEVKPPTKEDIDKVEQEKDLEEKEEDKKKKEKTNTSSKVKTEPVTKDEVTKPEDELGNNSSAPNHNTDPNHNTNPSTDPNNDSNINDPNKDPILDDTNNNDIPEETDPNTNPDDNIDPSTGEPIQTPTSGQEKQPPVNNY